MVDGGQKIQFFSGTNFTLNFSWRLAERSLDEAAGKLPKIAENFLLNIRNWWKKQFFTKHLFWSKNPIDWWIEFFLPHCRIVYFKQTDILHSLSEKEKKVIFTITIFFNKMFFFTRWNKKTTNQQKNCRQNAETFLHIVRKRQKTYSFPKIPIFPQIAPMDTFNQFLTKTPEVCRQKAKNFLINVRKWQKKHNFPQRFFSSNCSYGDLESSFDVSTEFPREIIKNSFSSSCGNDQKELFSEELFSKSCEHV